MKAAEDQQLPKEHLLPALSSGGCADPTQEGQQEAGKKEEPFGRDGWNVLAGRFCGSWPAAIHLGTKAKGRGSWGVRARDRVVSLGLQQGRLVAVCVHRDAQ